MDTCNQGATFCVTQAFEMLCCRRVCAGSECSFLKTDARNRTHTGRDLASARREERQEVGSEFTLPNDQVGKLPQIPFLQALANPETKLPLSFFSERPLRFFGL